MNPNKRQKISSSCTIKILYPQKNESLEKRSVKKRAHSPAQNHSETVAIKCFSEEKIELTTTVYISPKQALHRAYESVSQKFRDTKFMLNPSYTIVKVKGDSRTWCCIYTLKWPENKVFKKLGPTKRQAGHDAALATLLWLRKNKRITKEGRPIVDPETEQLEKKLYGPAKHVLHNTYHEVSVKLKNRELRLEPVYNLIRRDHSMEWSCKYSLKWPELKEFEDIGFSKREASQGAALNTLLWLKEKAKITENGHPIIAKEAPKPIPLDLDSDTLNNIKAIIKEYRTGFLPKTDDNGEFRMKEEGIEPRQIIFNRNMKQEYLGSDQYVAKEKTKLPISPYKDQIISLLRTNRVVIIKGEPGCGKSTRVPQYALESWIAESSEETFRIAVTQPRRLAAMSLAERVSHERNEECGTIVGYQIRLNCNFNFTTGRILYCTNGILLRHIQSDPSLALFPYVILDEAHERDANTDLLMKLLKTTLDLNPKLKLIIMSATIDTDMFQNYYENASVLLVDGFTYPVKTNFLDDIPLIDLNRTRKMSKTVSPTIIHEDVVKVINYIHKNKPDGTILCFLPGWDDISKVQYQIPPSYDLMVLCLHSKLQDADQWKIFWPPPPGVRKVILATNIAETSVTINDVVYVIDSGIHKESRLDNDQGVMCLDNQWISQASMAQRKGRAGRVQAGESFHLYTKTKYESMAPFTDPEIIKMSLNKIVLEAKSFYWDGEIWDFFVQLPTPPRQDSVQSAVRELQRLKLLNDEEGLTALGKILAQFQLEPKLAKTLVDAVVYKCVTPVVDIVTIFSSEIDLFSNVLSNKSSIRHLKAQTGFKTSDHLALMMLFEWWLELMEERNEQDAQMFCNEANFLNHNSFLTILELRRIHFGYLQSNSFPFSDEYSDNNELIKAVLLSGLNTTVEIQKHQNKKVAITSQNHQASITSESVNYNSNSFPSNFLVYMAEVRSNAKKINLIRESSVISPLSMLLFSNKNLIIDEVNNVLHQEGSKTTFSCTKEGANDLQQCKKALDAAYQYFVSQMVSGEEIDPEINQSWDKILHHLNDILLKHFINF